MIRIIEKLQVGREIYSPIFGEGQVISISNNFFDVIEYETNRMYGFDEYGRQFPCGECLIFPSKDEKDWSLVNFVPKYETEIIEPDPVYWFRVTNDKTRNAFLYAKLQELTGKDKIAWPIPSEGMIWFSEQNGLSCFQAENKIARMAMMVGREINIKES